MLNKPRLLLIWICAAAVAACQARAPRVSLIHAKSRVDPVISSQGHGAVLSGRGDRVAFARGYELFAVDVRTKREHLISTPAVSNVYVQAPLAFSPDSRHLLFTGSEACAGSTCQSRVYSVPVTEQSLASLDKFNRRFQGTLEHLIPGAPEEWMRLGVEAITAPDSGLICCYSGAALLPDGRAVFAYSDRSSLKDQVRFAGGRVTEGKLVGVSANGDNIFVSTLNPDGPFSVIQTFDSKTGTERGAPVAVDHVIGQLIGGDQIIAQSASGDRFEAIPLGVAAARVIVLPIPPAANGRRSLKRPKEAAPDPHGAAAKLDRTQDVALSSVLATMDGWLLLSWALDSMSSQEQLLEVYAPGLR